MTIVLRPSVIEDQEYLRPEWYPLFLETVRDAVRDKIDALFSIGHTYSLGSDADMVCFFDDRSSEQALEVQRVIGQISRDFRLNNCDLITLIRESDGHVTGMESMYHVGPLVHLRSRVEGKMEAGTSDEIKQIIQTELDRRMAASSDPFNEEIVTYASHKTVSLIEHAGQAFDLESPQCVAGLGKVLSYAGHGGRQMMRAETREEPKDKKHILEWADTKDAPHMQELGALLREEQTFRTLLWEYAKNISRRDEYARYLRFVHEELSLRVINFTRTIRGLYGKKRS